MIGETKWYENQESTTSFSENGIRRHDVGGDSIQGNLELYNRLIRVNNEPETGQEQYSISDLLKRVSVSPPSGSICV